MAQRKTLTFSTWTLNPQNDSMSTNGINGHTDGARHTDSFLHDASNISPVNGLPFYKPIPADVTINNHKDGDKGKILFKNVNIFDSTGADLYPGDVLIEGERIKQVGRVDFDPDSDTLVIDGQGTKTLISGLVDAHSKQTLLRIQLWKGLAESSI